MFVLFFLIGLIILLGVSFQFISVKRDRRKYHPLGKMIHINNERCLHTIYKKISDHVPTVILEAGNGLSSTSWQLVQSEIEKFANCVSYDRAGFGFSDYHTESCSNLHSIKDLHALLSTLNMPKPYILVGHSYGGMLVRLYANQYPDHIAGIILVDAFHEEQLKLIPLPSKKIIALSKIMMFSGLFRLFSNKFFQLPSALPFYMRKRIYAEICTFSWLKIMEEIFDNVDHIVRQAKSLTVTNIPTTVIAAGLYTGRARKFKNEMIELQKDLVKKSNSANYLVAEKSAHDIPLSQPEIIIAAINNFILNRQEINQ